MCLAIPGKIISLSLQQDELFSNGRVSFGGIVKEVNLCMIPNPLIGEYVLVHVGVAIQKVDEQEALLTLKYFELLGELSDLENTNL